MIQSQILRTKVIRIAWQTVTRIPNEIQGVKELKKIEIIPQTNFERVLTVTRIRANLRDRFFKLTVKKKEKEKGNQGDKQVEGKKPVFPNGTLRIKCYLLVHAVFDVSMKEHTSYSVEGTLP